MNCTNLEHLKSEESNMLDKNKIEMSGQFGVQMFKSLKFGFC